MASDTNRLTIIGRLTRDAELRYTASGTALCSFSIAVNRSVKKGSDWTTEVSFFDITLWAKQAEGLHKHLVKGHQIAIDGSLVQERWEKDGVKQSKLRIQADSIQLLGGKNDAKTVQTESKTDDFDPSAYEDDIPF